MSSQDPNDREATPKEAKPMKLVSPSVPKGPPPPLDQCFLFTKVLVRRGKLVPPKGDAKGRDNRDVLLLKWVVAMDVPGTQVTAIREMEILPPIFLN